MASLQLPIGSPNNPSESIAESLSPAELQMERSILTSLFSAFREHKASLLLSLIALTTGSAAVVLYYTNKASSLSSKASHHHQAPSSHPFASTIASLQREALHAVAHRDYSAALTLLSQALSFSSIPPPLPPSLLSSLTLDRANVHFLLHSYPLSFHDASLASSIPSPPTRSRAFLLQGRCRLMEGKYEEASEWLVKAVHEEQRREREEGRGEVEVGNVARHLLRQSRELLFLRDHQETPQSTSSPPPPSAEAFLTPSTVVVTPPPNPPTRPLRSSSDAFPTSSMTPSSSTASTASTASAESEGLRPPSPPDSPLSPVSPVSPTILDAIKAVNATAEKKRRREEEKKQLRGTTQPPPPEETDQGETKEANPSHPAISQWREGYRMRHRVVV